MPTTLLYYNSYITIDKSFLGIKKNSQEESSILFQFPFAIVLNNFIKSKWIKIYKIIFINV